MTESDRMAFGFGLPKVWLSQCFGQSVSVCRSLDFAICWISKSGAVMEKRRVFCHVWMIKSREEVVEERPLCSQSDALVLF